MSRLLEILTQGADENKREMAAIEVGQQNVNLQAFRINTQRSLAQKQAEAHKALKSPQPNMWATYDTLQGEIKQLNEAIARIDAYETEFFGEA